MGEDSSIYIGLIIMFGILIYTAGFFPGFQLGSLWAGDGCQIGTSSNIQFSDNEITVNIHGSRNFNNQYNSNTFTYCDGTVDPPPGYDASEWEFNRITGSVDSMCGDKIDFKSADLNGKVTLEKTFVEDNLPICYSVFRPSGWADGRIVHYSGSIKFNKIGTGAFCGDGFCQSNEDSTSCPADCSPVNQPPSTWIFDETEYPDSYALDCEKGTLWYYAEEWDKWYVYTNDDNSVNDNLLIAKDKFNQLCSPVPVAPPAWEFDTATFPGAYNTFCKETPQTIWYYNDFWDKWYVASNDGNSINDNLIGVDWNFVCDDVPIPEPEPKGIIEIIQELFQAIIAWFTNLFGG